MKRGLTWTGDGRKHEMKGMAKSPPSRVWNASWRVLRNGIYLCGGFDSLPVAKAFCHKPILFPSVR